MATVYSNGQNSWQAEITYSTYFNETGTYAGQSTIVLSSFRIKKASSTTQPSTTSGSTFYVIINGTSVSIGAHNYTVPAGGNWGASEAISWSGNYSPGASVNIAFDDPWNNIWVAKGTNSYGTMTAAAKSTYQITYNANSGTSTPSTQTKTWGTNLTLANAISRNNTTANGYTVTFNANGGSVSPTTKTATDTTSYSFTGWKSSATGTTWSGGATNFSENNTTTLTAQWSSSTSKGSITTPSATKTSTSTRTVTFDATTNGGTCSTASSNSTATVTYAANGWYTATSSGTKRCANGGSYTPSKTETVYQQWGSGTTGTFSAVTLPSATKASGTSTRTVTFDATTNGGTCSTSSLNSTATVTYSCSGWFTAASGGTKRGAVGGTYTPSAAEKIYAQFTSSTGTFSQVTLPSATKSNGTSTRTVTINANGGSSTVTSRTSSATVTYTHSGWFTAASGGTKRGASGDKYTPSASEKIYAQFTSSTGSYSSVTLPTTTECTKSGATLLGFSTSDTATTATYAPGASYTPSANVILYAVWQTLGQIWIKKDGAWVQGEAWVKIDGTWKKGQQLSVKNSSWKNSV